MNIHIAPGDGVPVYLQIINQVKHLIAAGRLVPGDEMPPIRTLAQQLLINPNTVARAYRDMEAAGIVVTRRGAGTVVSESASPLARAERLRILAQRVDALLAEAHHLGFGLDDITRMVHQRHPANRNAAKEKQR